jgi:creatinine amidohydrolase/Fe(II)-dependent formamide hydrolase-like protein
MRFEHMRPAQIRSAIARGVPALMAIGVLEHHGEHLGVGMDGLAVVKVIELLERDNELIVLPPFWYGAASNAVAMAEGSGTVHVDAGVLAPFAEALFGGLLACGLRNIHAFIHHQTEDFTQGMPTDLAFKLGARQAIFKKLEAERGQGWWGRNDMAEYYRQKEEGTDPFSWIRIHPLMGPDLIKRFPFDHAGIGETALMMILCPEAVDRNLIATNDAWYTADAGQATPTLGDDMVRAILADMRQKIVGDFENVLGADFENDIGEALDFGVDRF